MTKQKGLENLFSPYNILKEDEPTGSTLARKEGILVLRLFGTPRERGEAHGRLMKQYIHDTGINTYYGNFLHNLYSSSDLAKKLPPGLRKPIGDILESWYYAPFEKMLLPETKEELEGIADSAGFDRNEIFRGYAAPDLMEHLAAGFLKGGKQSLGNYYLGGCSAFYVRGSALRPGAKAMLARNMDFPGVFVWKNQAVVYSYPDEEVEIKSIDGSGTPRKAMRRKQPYVYVTASGFPGNGLTGFSGSGIAMSTFVLFSSNISKRGMLSLDFNHHLLTRHDSIEAIIDTIEGGEIKTGTPHAVLFADEKQAVSVEADSKRSILRGMDRDMDVHIQTNHFINPRMRKKQIEFPLEQEHTIARFRTLKDAVEENYGGFNIQRMIDVISSNQYTVSGDVRLLGDFPAQPTTLKSVVFEPKTGNFWVASGVPPAVCYNSYVGFTFSGTRDGKDAEKPLPSRRRSNRPVFKEFAFKPVTEKMKRSLSEIMLSQELLKQGKLSAALSNAEKAISLYPDPGYKYVLGILSLKGGDSEKALKLFREIKESYPFGPVKYSALLLWEARTLDLLGNREEALEIYHTGLDTPGIVPHMEAAFNAGLKRPFQRAGLPASFDYFLLGPLNFI